MFGFDFLYFKRECFRFNESRASTSNRPHQIRSMSKQPACLAAAAIKPQRHIKPYSPPAACQNVQRIKPQQINSTRMSSNVKKSTSTTSKRQAQTSMSKNVQHVKPQQQSHHSGSSSTSNLINRGSTSKRPACQAAALIKPPAAHQTSSAAAAHQTTRSKSNLIHRGRNLTSPPAAH